MADLKALALKLIASCEQLYAERTLLEAMMEGAKVPGWKKVFEEMKNDPQSRGIIRQQFQPLYDVVQRESDAGKALEELLRVLPKHDKVN
jgi:hypothetical protein